MKIQEKIQNNIRHISSFQIIILGFLSVILVGSLLLMLPISTIEAGGASFKDALFTSVSATCVTGLILHNTAEYWTIFGQVVILCMIQIGGMGVVTLAIIITMFSGKKIGLMQRSTMQEAISAHQVGGIVNLTRFIVRTTLIIEFIGAVCLVPSFCREYGGKGIWYAVFHSISAFCNAGFDLLGTVDGNSSLMQFSGNPFVNIPIILLILAGGIGFLTWDDIRQYKWNIKKYHMQTKVVLVTSVILLVLPVLYYFFFEFSRDTWRDLSTSERWMVSVFQAVTPRTAGFNTVDLAEMSDSSKLIMIILMLIGGASGSTAGGFKMTTLAVLFMTVWAVFRHRGDVQCFGRRISTESVYSAITILVLYLLLFMTGGISISMIDSVPLISALFEAASAVATVGLSLNMTPELSTVSQIILILLMFFGRVGGLTLIFSMFSDKKPSYSKFPEEKMTVG